MHWLLEMKSLVTLWCDTQPLVLMIFMFQWFFTFSESLGASYFIFWTRCAVILQKIVLFSSVFVFKSFSRDNCQNEFYDLWASKQLDSREKSIDNLLSSGFVRDPQYRLTRVESDPG
jgi:hypothetical protein